MEPDEVLWVCPWELMPEPLWCDCALLVPRIYEVVNSGVWKRSRVVHGQNVHSVHQFIIVNNHKLSISKSHKD